VIVVGRLTIDGNCFLAQAALQQGRALHKLLALRLRAVLQEVNRGEELGVAVGLDVFGR